MSAAKPIGFSNSARERGGFVVTSGIPATMGSYGLNDLNYLNGLNHWHPMKLYNVQYSGNSYKVRLLLSHLGIPCEIIEVDILNGESRTAEFLKINPNGRTPVLDDNGFVLAESNAIITYLARGTKFLPEDRKKFALVFQWMFFEQYSHEPYIATSRFWIQHKSDSPEKTALLASKRDGGWAALKIMEEHLGRNHFFVGDYSIADIALFAYTHVAHEGGFPLDDFPKIRAWIERAKSQPGFVPMV